MSDAQGISEKSDTAPLAANTPAAESGAGRSSNGWPIRLLATVGALVFAYAAWLPWAVISTGVGDRFSAPSLIDPNFAFTSRLVKLGSLAPTSFEVAAFSMLGLLLAPLLWRPADSLIGAFATHIFGLWLTFATVFVIVFGISPLVSGTPQPLAGAYPLGANITITGKIALGFWVAVIALAPMWIAVVALLVSEWRRHAFWHLPGNDVEGPRTFIQLPGASVLNLGLIIWALGYFVAGWASLNCTQSPLFFSSCQGIPASGALSAGIAQAGGNLIVSSATDPNLLLFVDPGIARYAIGILLGVGALLIFLGVWLRAVTRAFCVWTTLWLLAAVALAGVAFSGVGALVAHPTRYGLTAGTWSGESGIFVTLLGLIIAIAGLGVLTVAALRKPAEE